MSTAAAARSQPDSETRRRMIDATISCILDRGFYRASSNEIARSADVSWGVIQYHFGTRERLMLAVLQDGAERFIDMISGAKIDGDTAVERFGSLLDLLVGHYSSPDYLARLQIVLNMNHDPRTNDEITATLAELATRSNVHIRRLLADVLGEGHRDPDAERTMFLIMRGFGISHQLLQSAGYDGPAEVDRSIAEQRRTLIRLLTPFLEQATASG